MTDLKKIVSVKDYKVFAGPDWPPYDDLVNGIPAVLPKIQVEVEEFIRMMTQTYNELNIDEDTLAENNQQRQNQLFYDKKYIGKKCHVPWTTLGVNAGGNVYICLSPSWIPKFVGNLLNETDIYNILNSKTAQEIRQEVNQGRYFYCNNKICTFFSIIKPNEYLSAPADDIGAKPLDFVTSADTIVTSIPTNLIFDFDYTCNFKCPSCRTELINDNKHHIIRPKNNQIVEKIKHLIIDKIDNQPINIRWCGGEPFISDVYLELLDYIVNTGKPNIKHTIQTNGSYLKSKADLVTKLLPVTTELRISFDAATEETYNKVRVNGIWNNLLDNVKWVKNYITTNNLNTKLSADFVVQLDNYHEIPAFVELCNQLDIEHINFQKMWNWGTWDQEVFDEKNIFNPQHPKYDELVKMFKQANREIPF